MNLRNCLSRCLYQSGAHLTVVFFLISCKKRLLFIYRNKYMF